MLRDTRLDIFPFGGTYVVIPPGFPFLTSEAVARATPSAAISLGTTATNVLKAECLHSSTNLDAPLVLLFDRDGSAERSEISQVKENDVSMIVLLILER